MSLDYAVLGFLSADDLSGYDLKTRCFDGAIPHFWTADQAQIYRTLDRLEQAGRVTSRRLRQTNRPDRKVYSITRSGRESLAEWLAHAHEPTPYRDPLLIQLYFADEIPCESTVELLATQREMHQERLDELRLSTSVFVADSTRAQSRAAELRRMTYDATMAAERATIDWLDDCIEILHAECDAPEGTQRSLFGNGSRTTGRKPR